MGYESRIIVARIGELDLRSGDKEKYCVKLAEMWMSRCGNFVDIFEKPIDFELYGDGFEMSSDEEYKMTEDCYGKRCCYADMQTVIDWLEKAEAAEHYRRFTPAIAMLKAYAAEEWDGELVVIHYGY